MTSIPATQATGEVTTFRSPGVAGDILLLVILLPIGVAALTFLFLFPVTIVADLAGLDLGSTMLVWAGTPAVALTLLMMRLRLFWSITLDRDALLVGKWWPRRVPYERIRYLSSGAASDATAAVRKDRREPIPFVFATGMFVQRRLFLLRNDAERCLRELYARCPNAGAIDADGNAFLPRNPAALPFAKIRLAETLAIRGVGAISIAAGTVLARLLALKGTSSLHDLGDRLRVSAVWWAIYPLIPALVAYGSYCFHQMRRVLRAGPSSSISA